MHVVHLGKYYPPDPGGMETVSATLARGCVERGVRVTCVVATDETMAGREMRHGVEVVRVQRWGTLLSQPFAPGLARAARAARGDLLQVHHPNPFGDLVALADRRPLVVTHHSDVVRQSWLRLGYWPLVRAVLQRARRITVSSEQLLARSLELRGFERKVRVIPFGVELDRFRPTPEVRSRVTELRASWAGWGDGEGGTGARGHGGTGGDAAEGRADGLPVVLTVGRLVPYKGFEVLIRAMAGLQAQLVIVGTGPLERRLRRVAAELWDRRGAGARSAGRPSQGPPPIFAGQLSDADLLAHYHACDVFCLPSVSSAEAFGVVLLEAMACGKPLLTTALSTGVLAVNRWGETGLVVPPNDVPGLKSALKLMLSDAGLRAELGEGGRRVVEREYTAARMTDAYLEVYREALGG